MTKNTNRAEFSARNASELEISRLISDRRFVFSATRVSTFLASPSFSAWNVKELKLQLQEKNDKKCGAVLRLGINLQTSFLNCRVENFYIFLISKRHYKVCHNFIKIWLFKKLAIILEIE